MGRNRFASALVVVIIISILFFCLISLISLLKVQKKPWEEQKEEYKRYAGGSLKHSLSINHEGEDWEVGLKKLINTYKNHEKPTVLEINLDDKTQPDQTPEQKVSMKTNYQTDAPKPSEASTNQEMFIQVDQRKMTTSTPGILNLHIWEAWCGTRVEDLKRNKAFPLYPSVKTNLTRFFSQWFETGYGERIFGYIHPPETGNYTFAVSCDDNCEVWLSNSPNPEFVRKIAWVGTFDEPANTKIADFRHQKSQISKNIFLRKEEKYFIEALHKQAAYKDHILLTWLAPSWPRIKTISTKFISSYITNGESDVNTYAETIPVTRACIQEPYIFGNKSIYYFNQTRYSFGKLDNRMSFHLHDEADSSDFDNLLPEIEYKPSYVVQFVPKRYEGVNLIHESAIYPDDHTELSHMLRYERCEEHRLHDSHKNLIHPSDGENGSLFSDNDWLQSAKFKLQMFFDKDIKTSRNVLTRRQFVNNAVNRTGLPKNNERGMFLKQTLVNKNEDYNVSSSKKTQNYFKKRKLLSVMTHDLSEVNIKYKNVSLLRSKMDESDDLYQNASNSVSDKQTGKNSIVTEKVNSTRRLDKQMHSKQTMIGYHSDNIVNKIANSSDAFRIHNRKASENLTSIKTSETQRNNLVTMPHTSKPKSTGQSFINSSRYIFKRVSSNIEAPTNIPLRNRIINRVRQRFKIHQFNRNVGMTLIQSTDETGIYTGYNTGISPHAVRRGSLLERQRYLFSSRIPEPIKRKIFFHEGVVVTKNFSLEYNRNMVMLYDIFGPSMYYLMRKHERDFSWGYKSVLSDCKSDGNLRLSEQVAEAVVKAFMKAVRKRHGKKYSLKNIINVEENHDVVKGNRYFLELELEVEGNEKRVRLSRYVYQDYETTNLKYPKHFHWKPDATVHIIVPVKDQGYWVQHFIQNMERVYLETNDPNFNIIIVDFESSDINIQESLRQSKLKRFEVVHLKGPFQRALGLQAGADTVKNEDDVIFTCDLHLEIPSQLISIIRKHTIKRKMTFAPMVHRLSCGYTPELPYGLWEIQGYGLFAITKHDYDRIGGMNTKEFKTKWGGEDWEFLDRALAHGLEVERFRIPNFFHYYHSKKRMWVVPPITDISLKEQGYSL